MVKVKNIVLEIRKEMVLKFDFVKLEFEIGWVWVIICLLFSNLIIYNIINQHNGNNEYGNDSFVFNGSLCGFCI